MRRTTAAALTTRTPDNNDRQRCHTCGDLVLDGFEAGHAQGHLDRREGTWPVRFTSVEAIPIEHDPAAREGGGLKFSQPTDPKIKEI